MAIVCVLPGHTRPTWGTDCGKRGPVTGKANFEFRISKTAFPQSPPYPQHANAKKYRNWPLHQSCPSVHHFRAQYHASVVGAMRGNVTSPANRGESPKGLLAPLASSHPCLGADSATRSATEITNHESQVTSHGLSTNHEVRATNHAVSNRHLAIRNARN